MDYLGKIQRILDKSGMSQQSLAEKLGASTVTVNNWINGKTKITRKDIIARIDCLYESLCLLGSVQNTVMIGDNINCLKRMQKDLITADVIYIDPPYNTGNKFSYNDKRSAIEWIKFISERLAIAKDILAEDGTIFISIDDNSLYELKLACDDIFGRENFLGNFITKQAMRSNSKQLNTIHEYVLAYAKNKKASPEFKIKRTNNPVDAAMIKDISVKVARECKKNGQESAEKLLLSLNKYYMEKREITWLKNYNCVDSDGRIFFPKDLSVPGEPAPLSIPEIGLDLPALNTRKWSTPAKIIKLFKADRLHFKNGRPYEKYYIEESYDNVSTILDFYSRQGTNDLNKLGLRNLFDTPKPVELIKYLIRISTYGKENAIILDFFGGSGTTGQAVMEINLEDDKNYHYFIAQLDEKVSKDSPQYQFATERNITPSVDALMLYRLNRVREELNISEEINVISV